jgi:predicted nucleotidyltransferase
MQAVITEHLTDIKKICQKHHVARLDVFGSAATDQFDPATSDLDFVVEFGPEANPDRFGIFFRFMEELKQLFGRKVDLVEPGGLRNPYFIEQVNKTRRRVYAAP